jgi:hypothetical protein
MQDRRSIHRSRTCLEGRVAFDNGQSALDCLVRNLSQDGARIALSDTAAIPDAFEVVIPRKAEIRRARIIWKDETEAGVLFLRSTRGNVVSIETAGRIRKLQAEREALARRAAELIERA